MNAFAYIALICWPFVVLLSFSQLSPRPAAFIAVIAASLFLPIAEIPMPAGPAYSKQFVTSLAVLTGILAFDGKALMRCRLRWIDFPVVILCVTPICTSLSNDLGPYDGLVSANSMVFKWGIPYLIGRIYIDSHSTLHEFVLAMLLGVVVYLPLCVIEVVLSPQLHKWIYGFHQHSFAQTLRGGGFRPMIFMQHGLMVSFWMAMGTLMSGFLWLRGSVKQVWIFPIGSVAIASLIVTILCKSTGALVMLCVGAAALFSIWVMKRQWAIAVLVLIPVAYTSVRATGVLSRDIPLDIASRFVPQEKVGSMKARLVQEDLFSAHALKRPLFGWGAWQRNFPTDPETGKRLTRGVDGLWTIIVSQFGVVGLAALLGMFTIPVLALLSRMDNGLLNAPHCAPVTVALLVVSLFLNECLPNGMVNPVFLVLLGGIGTLGISDNAFRLTQRQVPSLQITKLRRSLYPGHRPYQEPVCQE